MRETIDEAGARRIALEHVQKEEPGVQAEIKSVERQDIWSMEIAWPVQREDAKGTQYAKLIVHGSGEVKDYEKTRFRSDSVAQRILSKFRNAFSRTKPPEAN